MGGWVRPLALHPAKRADWAPDISRHGGIVVEESGTRAFTRLRRELARLTAPQRAELEWRSMMRLMQLAQGSLTVPALIDILQRLLLARLFMDGQIDASVLRPTAAQPIKNIRPSSGSGRPTGVGGHVTGFLRHLIGDDSVFGSATQEAASQRGMGIYVADGDPILADIRQIASAVHAPWESIRPLTFENTPAYLVSGQHGPVHVKGDIPAVLCEWYQQVIAGQPPNNPLLRDVAQIDSAIWQAGGSVLVKAIETVMQRHALAATANGEDVALNPETGKLRLIPVTDLPEDMAAYARRKILKAAEVFELPLDQPYTALAPDLIMLRRAVDEAGNLPVELYDACTSALRLLARRAGQQECPAVEGDALLEDYRERLREVGFDILGSDPETRNTLERRRAINRSDGLIAAREDVLQVVQTVAPALEGHFAKALPEDAEIATNVESEPSERAIASFRLSGRLLRIVRFAQDVGKGVAIGGCAIGATVDFVQRMQFLATDPTVHTVLKFVYQSLGLV